MIKCPDCGEKLLPYSNNLELVDGYLLEINVQTCPKCKNDVVTRNKYEISIFDTSTKLIRRRKKWFS